MALSGCRVTEEEVQAIIELDSSIDLEPFIETANILVTKHCEEANSAYTATELLQIEKFLSAHLATLRDPRVKSESVGKISMTYESDTALFFSSSKYGQTALMLDWYGGLAALESATKAGGKRTAGITWLGTASTELEE